ncbi:alanine racemase [Fusibacter ferrireducens]|uniref:Alanine racemase n=1 Tax=Fusibacter ferrireducens TaxID=2785058 RepID=A0ABR9ZQL2_9FIRM|nr:alanine racemase [Fusibacter ferrireducens]MBF4692747.1 alanine racemase [Fusibacter ferrireducens]
MHTNSTYDVKGTRAEINLSFLKKNFDEIRKNIRSNVLIAGVVKANAYGHDLHTMSDELIALGCDYLMVANLREALSIRAHIEKSGVKASVPIMVMGVTTQDDFKRAVKADITLTIFTLEDANLLNDAALSLKKTAKVHVKLDTGFNRLGYKDHHLAVEDIQKMIQMQAIMVEGLFTHLALKDRDSDAIQFNRFDHVIHALEAKGIKIPIKHACDSIGTIAYPERQYDLVRMGALLYGYCSRPTPFELIPIMTLKTNISAIKWIEAGEGVSYDYTYMVNERRLIATLPVGYADGVPRALSNQGYVIINGMRAPIVGLMCMDQCMVDITAIPNCKIGSEVILFGSALLPLGVLASLAKTNRNEILSRISMRVPRVYYRDQEICKIVDYLL